MVRHHSKHRVAAIVAVAVSLVSGATYASGDTAYAHRPSQQQGVTQVSDGAIAGVLSAWYRSEITQSKIARRFARSREVKDFAREMFTSHARADRRFCALLLKLRIKPQTTQVSAMIQGHSGLVATYLRKQSGKSFDLAYVNSQVMMHRYLLRMIDQQLLPKAQSPALKAELLELRKKEIRHIAAARAIRKVLIQQAAPTQQGR